MVKKNRGGRRSSQKHEPTLQEWRDLYRKMNDILEEAKNARASVVKIEVTPDWTVTRYWDGVAWRDKPNSMYDAMNERSYTKGGKCRIVYP